MTLSQTIRTYRLHFGAILLLIAATYYGIVSYMAHQWAQDDNYSHGFLVPLIAGYFLWQRWPELKDRPINPSNWGGAVVVLALLQLLLGFLASELFTMRSSLILLLAGLVLFLFGRGILKGMALPLAYLIFMVPIPYIIYDMAAFPLKMFVTKVSVGFLQLAGVVVMREGNIIMFPATTLEVADACSGIRSLTSLLALAAAYAFFVQTSTVRRWVIIASAIPIAIATNALRVIVTGFLAQWWGAKAAEGFFHEFAGMAVFVLAMVLLVAVGAIVKGKGVDADKRESVNAEMQESGEANASTPQRFHALPFPRFIALCLFLAATAFYIHTHSDTAIPTNRPFREFPSQVAGWKMTEQFTFGDDVLKVLTPTDYISRQYRGADGSLVSLYVGYHNGGKGNRGIHSPKHCLPGSGWLEISSKKETLAIPGGSLNIVRAVYQKGSSKELFLYWFQMMDKTITDEYSLKFNEIRNSLLFQRRDETFIRISVPFEGDEARANAVGEAFIRDFDGVFREFLPR